MLPQLDLLDRIIPIARAAGAIVMEVYATEFKVGAKGDASPVTEADHRGYYLGYANSVLWPVFHNRLDLAQFEVQLLSQNLRPLVETEHLFIAFHWRTINAAANDQLHPVVIRTQVEDFVFDSRGLVGGAESHVNLSASVRGYYV